MVGGGGAGDGPDDDGGQRRVIALAWGRYGVGSGLLLVICKKKTPTHIPGYPAYSKNLYKV